MPLKRFRLPFGLALAGLFVHTVALAASAPAPRPPLAGFSAERLQKFDAYWQDKVNRGELAGLVAVIARHGRIVHTSTIGRQDVAAASPMRADTIFRIYSMTKAFTAAAMMLLFEEGKWGFEDQVADYVPSFAGLKVVQGTDDQGQPVLVDPVHPMKMRELLTHTGGLSYGYFNQTFAEQRYNEVNVLDETRPLQVFIDKLAQIPLNAQPGAVWHYSLSADVQGYIVQKLAGMPLDRFMRERLFQPLGLRDTGFSVPAAGKSRLASLYTYAAGKSPAEGPADEPREEALVRIEAPDRDYTKPAVCFSGGGGLVSTAGDLFRFLQMLLNGGELQGVRILAPRTVELMRSNLLPDNIRETEPGRGWATGFAVLTDPARAGTPQGKGTFYWNGAAGTAFWVDPINDVIVIGLVQQWSTPQAPDFLAEAPPLVYQALVAP